MRLSREYLLSESAAAGFRPEMMEKVIHLLSLLQLLQSHPALKGKLVLKGGTALNLFWFEVPRLSVDIDLNYIGAQDRETMEKDKPLVERAIEAVCKREGYSIVRTPDEHAGGKFILRYASAVTPTATLQLDLNYMFRVPLWSVAQKDSFGIGGHSCSGILVNDIHEIAAGKLAALISRNAARDLYDAHRLMESGLLDLDRLRLAFVVYGAINRKDWRTVRIEDVDFELADLESQLLPVLRDSAHPEMGGRAAWAQRMVDECRAWLNTILPLTANEVEFLNHLLDFGEVKSELLTDDPDLQVKIASQPGILWKALNVRKHRQAT